MKFLVGITLSLFAFGASAAGPGQHWMNQQGHCNASDGNANANAKMYVARYVSKLACEKAGKATQTYFAYAIRDVPKYTIWRTAVTTEATFTDSAFIARSAP